MNYNQIITSVTEWIVWSVRSKNLQPQMRFKLSQKPYKLHQTVQFPLLTTWCRQSARKQQRHISDSQKFYLSPRDKRGRVRSFSEALPLRLYLSGKTMPSSETSERVQSAKRDGLSSGDKDSSDSKATQVKKKTRPSARFTA